MMRLVQFIDETGRRRVGVSSERNDVLRCVDAFESVYQIAQEAIEQGIKIDLLVHAHLSCNVVSYDDVARSHRLLAPLDHPDEARCLVSLTGLTHLGSAKLRNEMHTSTPEEDTDTIRMFNIGVRGGKPNRGAIGAQPEWAYKGDGRCVVAPERPLTQPAFSGDGGEEAEIAGLYIIDSQGHPWRVGFAIGNEFADHVLEKSNYLYLAHSKLRRCSFGPELLIGVLPQSIEGTVRIIRNGQTAWHSDFSSGEANMCHSIANLEYHHFKYELFRRPGDVHVHFFGASIASFGQGVRTLDGDIVEIDVPIFGHPLRNPITVEQHEQVISVRSL